MSTYPIPNVIAQHPRGERIMDVYSHLLTERIIYLGTAIDAGVANALIAQLIHLESVDPDRDVQLYVNCEGGDPSAMLAVHDTMRYIRPDVATTCVGQAISVGAVLLAAGAPGKRAALSHARVVLHQPSAQGRGPIPEPHPLGGRARADPGRHRGGARPGDGPRGHRAARGHRPGPGLHRGCRTGLRARRRGDRRAVRLTQRARGPRPSRGPSRGPARWPGSAASRPRRG